MFLSSTIEHFVQYLKTTIDYSFSCEPESYKLHYHCTQEDLSLQYNNTDAGKVSRVQIWQPVLGTTEVKSSTAAQPEP